MVEFERTGTLPKRKLPVLKGKASLMLLMFLVLLGVLAGTLVFCNMSGSDISDLSFVTQGFIKERAEHTFIQTFLESFSSSSLLVLVCFLMGFWAIAQPFEILVPFFRGLGLGASMSYIYAMYGIKGFFIILIMILPHAVISSVAIIFSARESIRLSNLFAETVVNGNNSNMTSCIKLYLLKFLILFVIIGLSSLLDSILTFVFAGILF